MPNSQKATFMSTAVIVALATAIPAILGAITALIIALRSNGTAKTAVAAIVAHATSITAHPVIQDPPDKLN
jgi:hypothetical protein